MGVAGKQPCPAALSPSLPALGIITSVGPDHQAAEAYLSHQAEP